MASTSNSNKLLVTGYLKTIIGSPVGKLHPLTSGIVSIGRSRECGIFIQDANISRSHCSLRYDENDWFISDLRSVNGTYLDGRRLQPSNQYPLKNGFGIYLGPPGEAPAAFVFMSSKPTEQLSGTNSNYCQLRANGESANEVIEESSHGNSRLKRRSDPETGNEISTYPRRKKTSSTLVSLPKRSVMSELPSSAREVMDDDGLSDCSFSSLDSLRTRIQKLSERKKRKKRLSRSEDNLNAVSSYASPKLKSAGDNQSNFESKPSTSAYPAKKIHQCKEFAVLSELFSDAENSSLDTTNGEDSASLLNDSMIMMDCDPYPFSQPLAADPSQVQPNKNNVQLHEGECTGATKQELTSEVKKLRKDKLRLSKLVMELKSDEFLKQKFNDKFQKMLEEELTCSICTELFIKAITLNCSHTFCERCISEWKKKKKQCPNCREKITSETKSFVMDSFINKAVEQLDKGYQDKRKETVINRDKVTEVKPRRKKGRKTNRRIRNETPAAAEARQLHGEGSSNIGVHITFSHSDSHPSIRVHSEPDMVTISSDVDYDSNESSSVEGYGFFGGYGRCYNCGRSGHWANGCPY